MLWISLNIRNWSSFSNQLFHTQFLFLSNIYTQVLAKRWIFNELNCHLCSYKPCFWPGHVILSQNENQMTISLRDIICWFHFNFMKFGHFKMWQSEMKHFGKAVSVSMLWVQSLHGLLQCCDSCEGYICIFLCRDFRRYVYHQSQGVEINICSFQMVYQLSSAASSPPLALSFLNQSLWHGKNVLDNWNCQCCLSLNIGSAVPACSMTISQCSCGLYMLPCARASKLIHQIYTYGCTYL